MEHFLITKLKDNQVYLADQEAKHCSRVLRKIPGDMITAIDGEGMEYTCVLSHITSSECIADIVESTLHPRSKNRQLTIGISPLRQSSRFEVFIEKCAELGVDGIVPLICHRSVKKRINQNRLNKILISGMKQSKRYYLTILNEIDSFENSVIACTAENKYIASCLDNLPILMAKSMKGDTTILIGPEGDFTEDEYNFATSQGFQGVSLGTFRYRTETAGIMAAVIGTL